MRDDEPLSTFLSRAEADRDGDVPPGHATSVPKSALRIITNAMKRSFASCVASELVEGGPVALLVGFFQDRSYLEAERARYEAFAATGVLVIAGYPGAAPGGDGAVVEVDTAGRRDLDNAWALVALTSSFGATLVARDEARFCDGTSLEAGRMFHARWGFRRADAVSTVRALLGPIRTRMPSTALSRAEEVLVAAAAHPPSTAESHLALVLEELGERFAHGSTPVRAPRFEERDLLTGLPNQAYLDRWLAGGVSAAEFVAMLIDVDDLGQVNQAHGRQAGDAALQQVARGLAEACSDGQLLVRLGEDEFVVISSPSTAERPIDLAQRFVAGVRALRLPAPLERITITASVGVAVAARGILPMASLRQALERAKQLGKDSAQMARTL